MELTISNILIIGSGFALFFLFFLLLYVSKKADQAEKQADPRYKFEVEYFPILFEFKAKHDNKNEYGAIVALNLFGMKSKITRMWAEEEKAVAEGTKRERTEEYRRNYISVPHHRDELLKNAVEITRDYQDLLRNLVVREYFNEYVSPEVIKMYEEPYKRLEMAKFWGLEEKPPRKTQAEVIKEKSDELKELIKARITAKVDFELSVKQHLERTRNELKNQYQDSVVDEIMRELEREVISIRVGQ